MWKKLLARLAVLAMVFGASGQVMAGIHVAEKLLVDLRAEDVPVGVVATWPNHGTLGDFIARGNLVAGDVSGRQAVTFDGQSYFEGPPSVPGIEGRDTRSIEVWAFNPAVGAKECLVSWSRRNGPDASNVAFTYGNRTDCGAFGHWNSAYDMAWTGKHSPAPAAGVWWYLVYTYDGTTARIYVNGEEEVAKAVPCATHANFPIRLGTQANNSGDGPEGASYFSGSIAAVRIHDGVLSPSDIVFNMAAKPGQELATCLSPEDGEIDVFRNVVLSWTPGEFAVGHDVYFGSVFEDVNDATAADPRRVLVAQGQTASVYTPADVLAYGQTYYWRIDEVNAAPDSTIFKGEVWSFTVEPVSYPLAGARIQATASSSDDPQMGPEKTIDASGLNARGEHSTVDTDMWLSAVGGPQPAWIQYKFDQPYRLHQMPVWNSNQSLESAIGLGVKNVTVEYALVSADAATEPGGEASKLIVAESLLVDLRARDLEYGAVTAWPNHGTLGDFAGMGSLVVEDVGGRKAVTFGNQGHFQGPLSVPGIEGSGTRSIEVWVFNPDIGPKECMVAWSHRGGPNGSNVGFTYGNRLDCGAFAHWGSVFDMGWIGPHTPAPIAGLWWYLVYTYDGATARLYVNGVEETTKAVGALVTHAGFPIRLGTQANNTGDGPDGASYFSGSIAAVRIHDGVLSPSDIAANFTHLPEEEPAGPSASDAIDWATLGEFDLAQAPGKAGYVANTVVDFAGAAATHVRLVVNSTWGSLLQQCGLSEVRFYYVPVLARQPQPSSGQSEVPADVVLNWRAGREAAAHDVYLGTEAGGLALAGTASGSSFDTAPLDLRLGQTYYWQVVEVNEAQTPSAWAGPVWNFSTPDSLAVDDFESYTDKVGEEVFSTWIDGYDHPTQNGGIVGLFTSANGTFCETSTFHAGRQSMPFAYDNTNAPLSEAMRTFATPQDWTGHGITTLVLFFHGSQGNTGRLYMKIDDTKIVYPGDPEAIGRPRWTQWNIDLASAGVGNLRKVTKLSIGVEGGSSGLIYIDDIRLYRIAPAVPAQIWIQAEAAVTLTAPMKVYTDDPAAMGGKYIGTDDAIGNSSTNPPAPNGTATYKFTVKGGVYRVSGRVLIPNDESFWVRIPEATTQTLNHSSGWVRWSDPPQGRDWHWADVFSADDGNAVVLFTMPAGTYTLEIGYREDGAWLDAIVIESVR